LEHDAQDLISTTPYGKMDRRVALAIDDTEVVAFVELEQKWEDVFVALRVLAGCLVGKSDVQPACKRWSCARSRRCTLGEQAREKASVDERQKLAELL